MEKIGLRVEGPPEKPRAVLRSFKISEPTKPIRPVANEQEATKTENRNYRNSGSTRAPNGVIQFEQRGMLLRRSGRLDKRRIQVPTVGWILLTVSLGVVAAFLILMT
jgi:hypothetical protein